MNGCLFKDDERSVNKKGPKKRPQSQETCEEGGQRRDTLVPVNLVKEERVSLYKMDPQRPG